MEQTRRTGLPKFRSGFRQQKLMLINDGDFNEIHKSFVHRRFR